VQPGVDGVVAQGTALGEGVETPGDALEITQRVGRGAIDRWRMDAEVGQILTARVDRTRFEAEPFHPNFLL